MNDYIVRNNKGNISYKSSFLKLFYDTNQEKESSYGVGFKCPLCENELLDSRGELICSNVECRYDKTFDEIIEEFCLLKRYERVGE